MPTTVVKTIIAAGGGDFTTLQAWEDAAPANLVTADQIWEGQVSGTITITSGVALTVSGSTSDSTRFKRLKAVAGGSFRDHASVQSNALRVNSANGATITSNASYALLMNIGEEFFRIEGLQLESTGAVTGGFDATSIAGTFTLDMDGCIVEVIRLAAPCVAVAGSGCRVRNSLLVHRGSGATVIAEFHSGASGYNNTYAVPSDKTAAANAIVGTYGSPVQSNCAFYGCTAVKTGGNTPTYTTCYSSVGSPPSGVTTAAYNTTQFVNITDATRDYRIPTGSALKDTGTTDSTNAANDIARTARPSGPAYDVGCWEFVTAASGIAIPVLTYQYRQRA